MMKSLQYISIFAILILSGVFWAGCSTDNHKVFNLDTSVYPEMGGTVSPSFGSFEQGTRLEITAIPAEGYHFVRWEGDIIGSENPDTVYINGDRHAIAIFADNPFNGGNGSPGNPYQVAKFDDLLAIADVEYLDKHFIQVNDIDASASEGYGDMGSMGGFPGIGSREHPFTGSYDGGGYQITNLHFKYSDQFLGFFRYIKDAEIKNLTIGQVQYEDQAEKEKMMDISNFSDPSTLDFYSIDVDSDNFWVGGALVAFNDGGLISNCHSKRGISTRFNRLGGLVGYNSGEIIHSSSESTVSGQGYLGGLVAINSGTIKHSYAIGFVGGMASAGGLVGYNYGGSIINSYAEVIIGGYYGGGLVALNEGLIQGSYAIGQRDHDSLLNGGGLVGINLGDIKDSYSLVDGYRRENLNLGGLVGDNFGGTITNSFSAGKVSDESQDQDAPELGGLIGSNSGIITSSYWNTESSGQDRGVGSGDSAGAKGLTTSQMTGPEAQVHMPEFDWTTVWVTTSGYPVLRWQVEMSGF